MLLKEQLTDLLRDAVRAIAPDQSGHDIVLEYPSDPAHGDYSCNVALKLAKSLKKSAHEVAADLADVLKKPDFIQAVEIAGPGFINFFVSPDYLIGNVRGILSTGKAYGRNRTGEGVKVMVEYSSPNSNKPLHLGHARNNFLGMAVGNVLEASGCDVIRTQNINDRGIHISKSMVAYHKWGRESSPESLGQKGDHFVGNCYVKFAMAAREDASLEDEARAMLKKWEENDPEVRALWATMNAWVLDGFNQTYEAIGSRFDEVTFESDISEGGRALVGMALRDGKVERIEGGALAINLGDSGLGDAKSGYKVLVRSDGTTIYMTQDLQLAVQRMEGTDLNRLVYVVGNEQDYHFKALFEILKRFGYVWASDLHHLSYGMVSLPSGKMKSREGTSVDLDNLLAELEAMADRELEERNMPYQGKERKRLIRVVALGALKYFILKVDSHSGMLYDPKSSLDFQGNTGPYLQYTHARIRSILRKSGRENVANESTDALFFNELEELALLRKLQLYPEVVAEAAQSYRIHLLATFLFELGQTFNNFYVKHSVLEAPSEDRTTARLALIAGVAQVLENGLALLGIEAPERM